MTRLVHAPDSPLKSLLTSLDRVAKSRAPVLVVGESGTGKEGVVRLVHELAPWAAGPFVPVNCGAIPGNLLESELFGHVRGAFTGADRTRVGRFEAASGGTLFLDEIGEMPLELQVKLLRVLQERVFVPVGASQPKTADVRVVAATNVDVPAAGKEGRFREALFFRLDVIRIELPPLRERAMDIVPLARHFLALHAGPNQSRVDGFTDAALAELERYPWPGNVRELENVIQGILVLKERGRIDADDVRQKLGGRIGTENAAAATHGPVRVRLPEHGIDLKDTLDRLEKDLIREALCRSNGNRARAASLLGLNRTTLVEKLRRWPTPVTGLDAAGPPAFGRSSGELTRPAEG
ncbi:MAG: sigma 54-interacting transcriptional regulator [Deltaproteobacteria bacterium]|nr:sigma 54-interacting transcriptional regulator [Deltaproteobacteria bacterium]